MAAASRLDDSPIGDMNTFYTDYSRKKKNRMTDYVCNKSDLYFEVSVVIDF